MKKFIVAMLSAIMAVATFAFAGCDGHTCTFESDWSYDATNHWHVCEDEKCEEVSDLAGHQMSGTLCSVCGYETFVGLETWDGTEGTVAEPENGIVAIYTAEELAALATSVNGGTTYSGVTVMLMDDINLDNIDWTPIGNSTNKFQGTFDGNGKTVYNLNVDGGTTDSNQGLFGYTINGEIKNLTVRHATVKGYLNVGVIAGSPYTSKYDNITISGLVKVDGFGYVGGAFGKNVYEDVSNVTINVDEGSYVKANSVEYDPESSYADANGNVAYRTYVGGLVGFMGEGGHTVSNVTSNIDVYGTTCDVGGITGIAHYGNSFVNCSSSGDVYITSYVDDGDQLEMGGIAGVWHNGGANVTISGCAFTGSLKATNADGVVYEGEFENNGLVGKAYSATGTGSLIIE